MMLRNKILSIFFFFLSFLLLFQFLNNKSLAEDFCEGLTGSQDTGKINRCIEQTQNSLNDTRLKRTTLQNEIAYQNNQIMLTQLKIQETENQIVSLTGQIDKLEGVLTNLSDIFAQRAAETYILTRTGDSLVTLLTSDSVSEFISRFEYLQRIQQNDRELLLQMQTTQTNYEDQRVKVEDLSNKLKVQKVTLANQKSQKEKLLEATKSDEKKYQQLLSEAKAQLAAFRRFIVSRGGATPLSNQTRCDSWGCYYNQRDSKWGSIGLGGSSYSTAEYGCLVSSVAMLATHYGKSLTPENIAVNINAFVPDQGYLYHSFSVNGYSFKIVNASKDRLDSELAAGRPVIAGLYSGPDHFIVITKKEGDNYIMNDPYLENGSNRLLTDKYKVSDITSLRLVQFN